MEKSRQMNASRTQTTDIIIGTSMMVVSLLCGITYSLILTIIHKDADMMKLPSYRFMFVLGLFDVAQCLPHFITGLFTIYQSTFFPYFAQFLGAIATPCYVGYTIMTLILAVNRFFQFAAFHKTRNLFNARNIKYWYIGCFSIWISFMAALASPWAAIEYIPDKYSWSYNYALPYSVLVQHIEMVIELGTIFVSAIFYILTICYHKNSLSRMNTRDRRVETKILQQVVVITIYCTVLNFFWHNNYLLPTSLWTDTVLNFMWILNSGVYPIIYLIVNRAIKESFRRGHGNSSQSHNHSMYK